LIDTGVGDNWQDESVQKVTVSEQAQSLTHMAYILRSTIAGPDSLEYIGQLYTSAFEASAAIEQLMRL
jgi:hypothetical protein